MSHDILFVCDLNFQIFMKPDFALEDPATFNTVLPWSHFNSAGGKSSRDVASSKLLQEKVNSYFHPEQHTQITVSVQEVPAGVQETNPFTDITQKET